MGGAGIGAVEGLEGGWRVVGLTSLRGAGERERERSRRRGCGERDLERDRERRFLEEVGGGEWESCFRRGERERERRRWDSSSIETQSVSVYRLCWWIWACLVVIDSGLCPSRGLVLFLALCRRSCRDRVDHGPDGGGGASPHLCLYRGLDFGPLSVDEAGVGLEPSW